MPPKLPVGEPNARFTKESRQIRSRKDADAPAIADALKHVRQGSDAVLRSREIESEVVEDGWAIDAVREQASASRLWNLEFLIGEDARCSQYFDSQRQELGIIHRHEFVRRQRGSIQVCQRESTRQRVLEVRFARETDESRMRNRGSSHRSTRQRLRTPAIRFSVGSDLL